MKTRLITLIFVFFALISFAQVNVDMKKESLEFYGTLKATNKTNFELSECIDSALMVGVESKTESEKDAVVSSFVNGEYSYTYFINNYDTKAGLITFKFEFQIANNEITFRYFDFIHEKFSSSFNSIGIIPREWKESLPFTKFQYIEILADISANMALAIKRVENDCLN